MNKQNEKNTVFLTHLSGFGGFLFPFGSVLIPLIIRETKKDESKKIDTISKDVVNFNLSYLLYTFLLQIMIVPFFIGSFFSNIRYATHFDNMKFHFNSDSNHFFGFVSVVSIISILSIVKAVLIIKAAMKANDNENFEYPYTIKFIN